MALVVRRSRPGLGAAVLAVALAAGDVAAAGDSLPALFGTESRHLVEAGDCLYEVARRRGLAYAAVARANGLADPNLIQAGRNLVLPTRMIVPKCLESGLLVNIPEGRLYHFRQGRLAAVYPCSVGLPTWRTPLGPFTVTSRVADPTWYMPADMSRREKVKREIIRPGPENPLGDRWIGTSLEHTGVHGTNRPMTIGRPLSHGCIRLYPEHIQALFEQVEIGEPGECLYETVKVAVVAGEVLAEVHPDIYGLAGDPLEAAMTKAERLGVRDRIDPARLREALERASGVPAAVGRPAPP